MAKRGEGEPVVLINARIFDGESRALTDGQNVYLNAGRIAAVSDRPPTPDDGEIIDCGGRTLMPGMIDAHIHAIAFSPNVYQVTDAPMSLRSVWATRMLGRMLDRGFTTVRDTGGADYGLAIALEQGWCTGPRLYYCGFAISETGGHGDLRNPQSHRHGDDEMLACGCGHFNAIGIVVDGVDGVRRVVRENLRRGSNFVKFMASGGVASTGDRFDSIQFSDDEVRAIVDEVERHEAYCTAHAHPDRAINRALRLGVHCIEHGTLIAPDTARLAADRNAAVVPTLAAGHALALEGQSLGLPPQSLEKLGRIADQAMAALENLKSASVRVGFGTDLLGDMERHQCVEFALRAPVFSAYELLVQATSMNAEIIGAKGDLGVVKAGALADLLIVDGDPLADIGVLAQDGAKLAAILQNGVFHKRTI